MWKLPKFQNRISQKSNFLMIAGTSGLAICASLCAEFIFGKIPCFLCLIQRGLYGLLLAITIVGIFSHLNALCRKFCMVLLVASSLVAGYHTLVQLKIVKDRCKNHFQVESITSYKDLLLESKISRPSCSEDIWKIGYIPISGINGILSIFLFILIWRKREENSATGET